MAAFLILDDSEARTAAEELRSLVAETDYLSRHLRERIAAMLTRSEAVEVAVGPAGLAVQPSPEMLSIIATLRAHGASSTLACPGECRI